MNWAALFWSPPAVAEPTPVEFHLYWLNCEIDMWMEPLAPSQRSCGPF